MTRRRLRLCRNDDDMMFLEFFFLGSQSSREVQSSSIKRGSRPPKTHLHQQLSIVQDFDNNFLPYHQKTSTLYQHPLYTSLPCTQHTAPSWPLRLFDSRQRYHNRWQIVHHHHLPPIISLTANKSSTVRLSMEVSASLAAKAGLSVPNG